MFCLLDHEKQTFFSQSNGFFVVYYFGDTRLYIVFAVRKKNICAIDFLSRSIQEGFWFWVLLDIEVFPVT